MWLFTVFGGRLAAGVSRMAADPADPRAARAGCGACGGLAAREVIVHRRSSHPHLPGDAPQRNTGRPAAGQLAASGPPQFLRITAAQCAREALAGFERGAALVFPGRAYRITIMMLPLLPRRLQRRQAARSAARMRRAAAGAKASG